MEGILGLIAVGLAAYLERSGSGGLFGLGDEIDDAVANISAKSYSERNVTVVHGGKTYVVSFERGSRWDDRKNESVPNRYITLWVHEGFNWTDARRMVGDGGWAQIISKALGIPAHKVRIGFGHNEFDPRPY